ncbi:hypothetical protein X943_002779 [Babesia divergens]|uniref:Succinate dehydrogenase assembly factor 4, mitochondrial n=1 Tax=Babesia divergens TaxID=32595 RepID=A0AAD9GAP0_BABDI|nr:hypothetical protein X943_002779 [Babesia divergens]
MNLLGGPAAAFIAAKPPEFRPLCVHSNAEATNAAYSTSVSNNGNAAEGAVACSGEDDETDGTESGRLSRNTALADALSDQEAESILQAHVAVASNTQGSCLNGTNKFKEYGNVYDKHEPTMFGDWSHMGRVTDF